MGIGPLTGRAVFLDRDGVINRAIVRDGKPYPPPSLEEMEILPGTKEALDLLKSLQFLLLVVTNQPDVSRGTQTEDEVNRIHAYLAGRLPIDDFLVCFHDNRDNCQCRKPKPGLLMDGARKHKVNLADSFLIGDRWRDVDAGYLAGCQTILIDYGYRERGPSQEPAVRVHSLPEAASWIAAQISNQKNGVSSHV